MKKKLLAVFGILGTVAVVAYAQSPKATINLYNWSNYIPPDLLKKYETDTGVRVNLDVYDSNESLLAKLQAGATGYDIIVPSDYMVKIMIDEKILEPINAAKLSNWKNVQGFSTKPPFDVARVYSAPYMWGVTGFTYDSARVPGGKLDDSWKSFFEPPEALRGQIVALNDPTELWNAATIYLKIDQCTTVPSNGERVLALLEKQKPFLAAYNSDGTIERMQAGEVIMHHQWNGAAHRTKEKLKSGVFVYPREGIPFWNDNFAVPKTSKNKAEAIKFINWMMTPEAIAIASNFTGYNNSIKGADKFFDAALKTDPAVNTPANLTNRFRANKLCSSANIALRDKVWTRLKR
jgi:spermidine/putrescine transport system substrate-binding protein